MRARALRVNDRRQMDREWDHGGDGGRVGKGGVGTAEGRWVGVADVRCVLGVQA